LTDDLLLRAKVLVKRVREVQKIMYQLAFIATSLNPLAEEAERIAEEMIEHELITRAEWRKAKEDVQRWRDKVLDKWGRGYIGSYMDYMYSKVKQVREAEEE